MWGKQAGRASARVERVTGWAQGRQAMGRSSAKQKYAPKAAAAPAAGGPSLCIDTIADPEGLQQHIQVCGQGARVRFGG